MRWPWSKPEPEYSGCGAWVETHDLADRYQVIPNDSERWWIVMDTVSPAREIVRSRNKGMAEWVAVAIDHYIHGAPGTIKREVSQGPP